MVSFFPICTKLKGLSSYNREQMSAVVDLSKQAIVQLVVDLTGVCGEPDTDIEKGMREEHTEGPDSRIEFRPPIMVSKRRRPRSGSSCSKEAAGVLRWRGKRAVSP